MKQLQVQPKKRSNRSLLLAHQYEGFFAGEKIWGFEQRESPWCLQVVQLRHPVTLFPDSFQFSCGQRNAHPAALIMRAYLHATSSPTEGTYIRSCVCLIVCRSSSRASSVSWLFWIRDKFCSSSSAKMSRSCWGSPKNKSGSCQMKKGQS